MVEKIIFLSIGLICGAIFTRLFIIPILVIPILAKWADSNPKVDEFFDAFFEKLGL